MDSYKKCKLHQDKFIKYLCNNPECLKQTQFFCKVCIDCEHYDHKNLIMKKQIYKDQLQQKLDNILKFQDLYKEQKSLQYDFHKTVENKKKEVNENLIKNLDEISKITENHVKFFDSVDKDCKDESSRIQNVLKYLNSNMEDSDSKDKKPKKEKPFNFKESRIEVFKFSNIQEKFEKNQNQINQINQLTDQIVKDSQNLFESLKNEVQQQQDKIINQNQFSFPLDYFTTQSTQSSQKLMLIEQHNYKDQKNQSSLNCVNFDYSGQFFAIAGNDKTIKIYKYHNKQIEMEMDLPGHGWDITQLLFFRKSQHILSISGDRMIKIWDLKLGQCYKTFNGSNFQLNDISVCSNDTYMVSVASDRSIKFSNLQDTKKYTLTIEQQQSNFYVKFTPDDLKFVTVNENGTIMIWDAVKIRNNYEQKSKMSEDDKKQSHEFKPLSTKETQININHANKVAMSSDGKYLAIAGKLKNLNLYSLINGEIQFVKKIKNAHQNDSHSIIFSQCNKFLISGDLKGKLISYNIETNQVTIQEQCHSKGINCMAINPSGTILVSGSSDGKFKISQIQILQSDSKQ